MSKPIQGFRSNSDTKMQLSGDPHIHHASFRRKEKRVTNARPTQKRAWHIKESVTHIYKAYCCLCFLASSRFLRSCLYFRAHSRSRELGVYSWIFCFITLLRARNPRKLLQNGENMMLKLKISWQETVICLSWGFVYPIKLYPFRKDFFFGSTFEIWADEFLEKFYLLYQLRCDIIIFFLREVVATSIRK